MAGRRRSDRVLWGKLRSPGRPGVGLREHRRRFWAFIAEGLSSEDAAMEVRVSQPVGSRWFCIAGGMAPSHLSRSSGPLSGRRLSFAEREEIALLRVEGHGVREVARRLGRAPSSISRELRRNAATRGGNLDYRATTAQWHAERAARRPKRAKLAENAALRTYVQERLSGAVAIPDGGAVDIAGQTGTQPIDRASPGVELLVEAHEGVLGILVEGEQENPALVAERGVGATARQPRRVQQIRQRGAVMALQPEHIHGAPDSLIGIKLPRAPAGGPMFPCSLPYCISGLSGRQPQAAPCHLAIMTPERDSRHGTPGGPTCTSHSMPSSMSVHIWKPVPMCDTRLGERVADHQCRWRPQA